MEIETEEFIVLFHCKDSYRGLYSHIYKYKLIICYTISLSCDLSFTKIVCTLPYIEAWWYTTPLTSQFIRQQVGGFLFDVGLLGPCRSMPRSAKDLAKHANDLAKHAKVSRGRCQACLGVVKQAYTSYVPTIYWSLVVHYSLSFIAYKAASGEVSFRCETPRTLQKHANVGQGPCKACRGRCKTCRDRPRTLLSTRRSCKASLHILDSHSFKLRFFVK